MICRQVILRKKTLKILKVNSWAWNYFAALIENTSIDTKLSAQFNTFFHYDSVSSQRSSLGLYKLYSSVT